METVIVPKKRFNYLYLFVYAIMCSWLIVDFPINDRVYKITCMLIFEKKKFFPYPLIPFTSDLKMSTKPTTQQVREYIDDLDAVVRASVVHNDFKAVFTAEQNRIVSYYSLSFIY